MIKNGVLLTLFAAFSASAASIVGSVPQPTYAVGETVPVTITASNLSDLYAYQFDLSFDPTLLSAQSVTEQGYFATNGVSFSAGTIDNAAGTITFIGDSLSGAVSGFTGTTPLVTVDFTSLAAGQATVTPENLVLLDSSLNLISATAAPVTVSIQATPEPGFAVLTGIALAGLIIRRRRIARS